MSAAGAVSVTGLKKLDAKLEKLSVEVRQKTIRKAMNASADIIFDRARRFAPDHSGRLVDSIAKRVKFKQGENAVIVGSVFTRKKGAKAAPHAHLVHYGTKTRVADHTWVRSYGGRTLVTVRGQSFGRMPANPFMVKAVKGKKMAVRSEFVKALRVAIDKVSR